MKRETANGFLLGVVTAIANGAYAMTYWTTTRQGERRLDQYLTFLFYALPVGIMLVLLGGAIGGKVLQFCHAFLTELLSTRLRARIRRKRPRNR